MKKQGWMILNIPNNRRKREYLYYLLQTSGFDLTPQCRETEQMVKYRHSIVNISGGIDVLRIGVNYAGFWNYKRYNYEKAIKLLEKKLKINRDAG